jgi:hypothetical protein
MPTASPQRHQLHNHKIGAPGGLLGRRKEQEVHEDQEARSLDFPGKRAQL